MTGEQDPDDWFAAKFGAKPEEPEQRDAGSVPVSNSDAAPPATQVPIVPASPLTPTAPPADEPVAFAWGLAPGGGAHGLSEPTPPPGAPEPAPEPAPGQAAQPAMPTPTRHPAHDAPAPPDEPAIVPWTPPTATPPPLVEPTGPATADLGPPTAAFSPDLDSWTTPSFDPELEGAAEAFAPEPVGTDLPEDESLAPSAIDALFGDAQFREYDDQPLLLPPFGASPQPQAPGALVVQPVTVTHAPTGGIPRTQRVLLWVAGGLLAAIALVGLFVLGTRLADTLAPSPEPVTLPEATEPALPATGPLPPGEYAWELLRGGECVEPFESAWQEAYMVVDCAAPHAAQLVTRAAFADAAGSAYPGAEELAARAAELCAAPTVIDYAAAAGITDLQVLASFAADEAEWNAGHHDVFCFAHRASGEPLTASIAAAPPP